jgi:hypothetical protein
MGRRSTYEEDDWVEDDRPRRRPRRKRRSSGIPAVVVLLGIFFVLILLGGGLALAIVLSSKRGDAEKGMDADKAKERLLGEWEWTPPNSPTKVFRLRLTKDEAVMSGEDTRTHAGGSESMRWEVEKVQKGTVVIRLRRPQAERDSVWSIEFDGDDRLRVTTVSSPDVPVRVFTRRSKGGR